VPLTKHRPWLRVRDGNYRLFLRPLAEAELEERGIHRTGRGYLVARVLDKKDARGALKTLRR
jgi:hypothetical protein